jgi:hypothetical protein
LREIGVLGKEPEARVDGVGAGLAGRCDDGIDVEQVDGCSALGVGDDRSNAQAIARSTDTGRNLTAIRDEN